MNTGVKTSQKNFSLNLPVTINEEEGRYWGECLVFPGCFSDGESLESFSKNMGNAVYSYIEGIEEGFFDVSNVGFLKFKLENGQVSSSFLKKINGTSYKELSYN